MPPGKDRLWRAARRREIVGGLGVEKQPGFRWAPAPKRFVRFPEAGHLNLEDYRALAAVKDFANGITDLKAMAVTAH